MVTHKEAGVLYTFDKPDPHELPGFTEFTYTSWFQLTDERFVDTIWVVGSRSQMKALIKAWNKKDPEKWHYDFS